MIPDNILRNNSSGLTIKILASICLILLAVSAIAAWNTPSKGYEPSIYSSTPQIFWISIIISIASGVAIIFSQIFNRGYKRNNRWAIGFLLMLLCFILCLSVFIIRGYYMLDGNGDTSTHIGYINQILRDGHAPNGLFQSDLIYPVIHFYTAELSLMTGQGIMPLQNLIPLYLALLFIGFMYLFIHGFLNNKGMSILALMSSFLIIADYYNPFYLGFIPYILANYFFPLAIFVFFLWKRDLSWGILSLLLLLVSVPFHPVLVIGLIATLALVWSFEKVLIGLNRFKPLGIKNIDMLKKVHMQPQIVLSLNLWFLLWISSFQVWDHTLANVMKLLEFGGPTQMTGVLTAASKAPVQDLAVYISKIELSIIAYVAIALIALPLIIRHMLKEKKIGYLLLLYAPFTAFCALILVFYSLNLGFSPTRLIFFIFIICTVFVGFLLYKVISAIGTLKGRVIPLLCLGLLLAFMVGLYGNGILTLYPSPYTMQPNMGTTRQDVQTMGWLLSDRPLNVSITSIQTPPYRYADMLISVDDTSQLLPRVYPSTYKENNVNLSLPYHFGYLNGTSLASAFNFDTYVLLTNKDKSIYIDVLPDMAQYRYTLQDFSNLENDAGLFKLYSSGEDDVWLTNHKSTPYLGNNG
ncbi:hypothetical protein MCP_2543 [Methanocella paludicola SANAE]|uniref:Glycosyltransferase RgtA/B/C/D-like domain-containing protein n=1 Tax=Methanocella paludicola (strain DSM 17711 / JCM 13418 / NBRC 101707 / SANAE) TaxID=304371 RepID=D1Z1P3_METPS|nr:hypothetical protein [Methanocella paludicola]BAI62615.1 hypothetical protein MCP_2543 [Methanocella paludicola SANAE]